MVCVDGRVGLEGRAHGKGSRRSRASANVLHWVNWHRGLAHLRHLTGAGGRRSPEKESIERPKGFSRFGRFHDHDPLRCYTSTLLLYLKTRWRPRRRPPKTSSKQETHKSSSMESGVVTDPANYPQLSFEHGCSRLHWK